MKTIFDNRTEWRNEKGELHCEDGPALIAINGDKYWYQFGELHRLNGPAVEMTNGYKSWYHNGSFRVGDVAVEYPDGKKYIVVNGKLIKEQMKNYTECTVRVFSNKTEWRNEKSELHRIDGPAIEYTNGDKVWYQNNQCHRTDGPASESANGDKGWYQNGELHRIDGPAIEFANGDKHWYQYGLRHRLDGPAVECTSGFKSWYINGRRSNNEADFKLEVAKLSASRCELKTIVIDGVEYELRKKS